MKIRTRKFGLYDRTFHFRLRVLYLNFWIYFNLNIIKMKIYSGYSLKFNVNINGVPRIINNLGHYRANDRVIPTLKPSRYRSPHNWQYFWEMFIFPARWMRLIDFRNVLISKYKGTDVYGWREHGVERRTRDDWLSKIDFNTMNGLLSRHTSVPPPLIRRLLRNITLIGSLPALWSSLHWLRLGCFPSRPSICIFSCFLREKLLRQTMCNP